MRFIRGLLDTPQTVLEELSDRYGPLCALGAGPLKMVVVGSPSLIRDLLMQSDDRFRWGTPLNPFPFVVGKHTMIASDGPDHRRRRGAVQQAFGRRRLNRWIPMIVERTDAAIDDLLATTPSGALTDLYPFGRRLLIEIVVRALFGERLVQHVAEIDARFERAQQYLSSPLVRQIPHPFPFTRRAGVRQDRTALDTLIDEAIAASRVGETITDDSGDVLDSLVHRSDLFDAEIRDQVKSLIGAGYDTTASSLAWIIWEAAVRPEVWTRLRAAAIDVEVGSRLIPKGTLALWSPYLAGRDPGSWTDPDDFRPERFADLDSVQRALADDAWVPFGRGPRMCVGFALAQMELTLIASRLAQRVNLTSIAAQPPAASGLVVSRPVGGVPMRVTPRTP